LNFRAQQQCLRPKLTVPGDIDLEATYAGPDAKAMPAAKLAIFNPA
jgi:hypothetical protein